MKVIANGCWRRLMLTGIYALGVFGILASSGDGSSSRDEDFICRLFIQAIEPAIDASNDVWVGVLAKTNDGNFDSVVRLNSRGSEQLRFDLGAGGNNNAVRTIAIAADASNDVYVGGDFSEGILRLNNDGTLDMGFAVGAGFNGRVATIVPLTNGDVYVGGFFSEYDGDPVSGLVRLDQFGTLDPLFTTVGAAVSNVESIALARDGSFDLYSGGRSTPWVERWSDTGVADTGVGAFNPPPAVFPAYSLATVPLPATEIYVGGTFTESLVRLNSVNGTTDGGFNVGTGFDDDVLSIELGAAGDIYAGGAFTNYQGVPANGIVRLNDNGSRDFNFSIGNGFTNPVGKVETLTQAVDGSLDVYVGGGFTKYDGADSNGIVRLDVDGMLDTRFAVEISADGGTCKNKSIAD